MFWRAKFLAIVAACLVVVLGLMPMTEADSSGTLGPWSGAAMIGTLVVWLLVIVVWLVADVGERIVRGVEGQKPKSPAGPPPLKKLKAES